MTAQTPNPTESSARGWLFYDARCGFCSTSVRRIRKRVGRLGYEVVARQTPWVTERLGKESSVPVGEMLLLTRQGRIFSGIDAYLEIASQMRWAKPLVWLARKNPIYFLLRCFYRWFAARRQRISAVCRLTPDIIEEVPADPGKEP